MPTIADEIRLLTSIQRRPSTTAQLIAKYKRLAPIMVEVALIRLRDDGAIACTNGVWWRRGENGHEKSK